MEASSGAFLPAFLKDTALEIKIIKNFYEDARDDLKQYKNDSYKLKYLFEEQIENISQQKRDVEKLEQKIKDCTTETKLEMEKRKVLSTQQMYKQEIERLIQTKQEISSQIEEFKSEKEKNAKELKNTHEAIKLAILYYKSALDICIEMKEETEDCTKTKICFSNKKQNDTHVKLQRKDTIAERLNQSNIDWKLLEMCPKVKHLDLLQEKLKETNDIQGFLGAVEKIL